MKKFPASLLLLVLVTGLAHANPITAINITLPANPDANTANWGTGAAGFTVTNTGGSATGALAFTITVRAGSIDGRIDPAVEESKILVIIKQNGKQVGGSHTAGSAPAAKFATTTKTWTGADATALLGKGGTLPPGDYELSVQFFGDDHGKMVPLSAEALKPFTIRGNDQQARQAVDVTKGAAGVIIVTTKKDNLPAPSPATLTAQAVSVQVTAGQATLTPNYPAQAPQTAVPTSHVVVPAKPGRSYPPAPSPGMDAGGPPHSVVEGNQDALVAGAGPQTKYQAPRAIDPVNGKRFDEVDLRKPIAFRWTPVVPKPQGAVVYRLSVWQLMQGQTGPQAIKANQPIITKDVDNLTQVMVTNPVTGPGQPPSPCEFVWTVQALDRESKQSYGANNGVSETFTYTVDANAGLAK